MNPGFRKFLQALALFFALACQVGCMPTEPVPRPSRTAPVVINRPEGPLCDPKQLLDNAIRALGGEAALRRMQQTYSTGQGLSVILNQVQKFRFKTFTSLPNRTRDEWAFENGITFLRVLNGEKGWLSENKTVRDMDPANLKAAQDGLYVNYLMTLVPLKESTYTLEPLREQRKDGYLCEAFKVKSPGRRDVTLFFDKQTLLPLILKTTVLDANQFTEKDEETYFRDFKESDGLKYASRWIVYTDGAKSMELTFSDLKALDKVEDSFFTKP